MYLGYSTWGMPTVPIDTAVQHCAALGFDGLELTVIPNWSTELSTLTPAERTRIRDLYRRHNLAIPAVAGHRNPMEEDPDRLADNLRRLHGAADLCAQLTIDGHTPPLNTTVGGKPEDWNRLRHLLVERIAALAATTGERGVRLAIEPHVGSLLDTPERVLWLVQQVQSPHLGINFDISHFNVMGFTIEQSVPALAPLAIHTHIKDERGVVPNYEFLIPGEGEFDYAHYLQAMHTAGYNGFITVEISLMVQRRASYDPLAAATQSYSVVNAAFAAAGIERSRRSATANS